ncbi:insulinase family protein [Actomonas aquatica]|uniref:Protease 3 n=1 Tax=Actomonas aquatica TaxID=2866162 RepID=A0ABZ1CF28_9BACT|nr:insulinase family protein [Opitutus sp. WL0086]WRQ90061.1 insulinase family protein [Opitutus sp. WL0086]
MLTRLLCLLLIVSAPAFAATDSALPPREVAPTDKAEFRRLTLDNGLKVLLVSDANFNKSAASLVVSVGQIDDPFEHAGLAHFLEHMLFLGTEKYPDVSEYSAYITANGGYNNAYTSTDHTNYQFEVRHEALEGALDRFAQFFIAPLFVADYTEREVNAVHNEAMRHVQNDLRRMLNVRRELYSPEAGESKFSTGNKDTLANATPAIVREFYENHYSADRMALAITGTASLDELERMARVSFSPIPVRDLPAIEREPTFLPHKEALRLATIEPVRELRQLWMEFVIPSTRPHFASKTDAFLLSLLNYAGKGGLVEYLKDADLATSVGGFTWTRTTGYESLFISADLTPNGADNIQQVMETFFAYIEHLKDSPFPADFYADQARIANLQETFEDRGEGANLATRLANNALFFPLDVAERADIAWGEPDEAAYREFLGALTPDNMLVTFQAKGVPTDRTEEIYGTAYGYSETAGDDYNHLVNPPAIDSFALPSANPFLPGETKLIAERPLSLIDEAGLQLYYAQDVEFERPQATVQMRFVPTRDMGTAETDLLLRFFETCLYDAFEAAAGDASVAGLSYSVDIGMEGFDLAVTGFADSPARFIEYVTERLLDFEITPTRFASLHERVMRNLRSYDQTEAYQLASHRSSAALREFYFLPNHSLERAESVTWDEVHDLATRYFATGKVEVLVHGHLTPERAIESARAIADAIGAEPAAEHELLRRRQLELAAGEPVIDTGAIEGVNSTYRANYLLPDATPAERAAAEVIGTFMSEPFFTELRTKQQLGYIVGSGAGSAAEDMLLLYVIQSSTHAADDLRQRAETFIATLPDQLAALPTEQWETLLAGARSSLGEKPKSIADKTGVLFARAYDHGGDWERQHDTLAAIDQLDQAATAALFRRIITPDTAKSVIVLLSSGDHAPSEAPASFSDREAWKAEQQFN